MVAEELIPLKRVQLHQLHRQLLLLAQPAPPAARQEQGAPLPAGPVAHHYYR